MGQTRAGFADTTAIAKQLRRLSQRLDLAANEVYAARGFTFEQRWFGVLNQLLLNGPMSTNDIAKALEITHVSVNEARNSLARQGYLQGTPDPADRRRTIIELTPAGHQFVDEVYPVWVALEAVSQDLNREAGDLTTALSKLEAALNTSPLHERVKDKLAEN